MNALYLYSQVMPYTIASLQVLIKFTGLNIHLVHYPISKTSPYQLPDVSNIFYYDKSVTNVEDIKNIIIHKKPKFVFVSGWSNKDYLKLAEFARKQNIPVITGCDTLWRNDLRQKIATIFSKTLIRKYFTYIMVPGFHQYDYARLLGFSRENILFPLYTANLSLFDKIFEESLSIKEKSYPHNILFVGRFEKVKGIRNLINAFQSIVDQKDWTLTLIGNGSLKEEIVNECKNCSNIYFKNFLQEYDLAKEVQYSGIFCLPSIYEPWGVVIQEFAAAGLPLLTSNICGASSMFLRENYNGYAFSPADTSELKNKLLKLISLPDDTLRQFSIRSNQLSKSLTPEMYASNFLKFLDTANNSKPIN